MAREPKAEVEISAHSRGLSAKLRQARAKFGSFGVELKKNVFGKDLVEKGFFSKAGASMLGNVGARGVGALTSFVADVGRETLAFEDRLNRLQIAADKTPEEMADFAKAVRASSSEFGMGAGAILDGAAAYVRLTGDMDGAIAKQRTFTRVAQATGSSVADIAETAAAMKKNLDISDTDTEAAFAALAIQGKAGAVELNELAQQMSNIAPMWKLFDRGGGLQGLKELGAALQVAKGGFGGDASQTVTGVQSLLMAFQQNGRKIEQAVGKGSVFNIDPKTGAKTMRNVFEIVQAIGDSKLAKDPTMIVKALGRVEAFRAYQQLVQNRDVLEDLVAKASDAGVIQRDLDARLKSTAGRTQVAWEKAKNSIAEAFTPERIEAFTSALVFIIDKAAKLVGFIEKIGNAVDKMQNAVGNAGRDRGRGQARRRESELFAGKGSDRATVAQAMLTEAAALQRKMEDEGFTGGTKYEAEGKIEELRRRAMIHRNSIDPWSATGDEAKRANHRRVQPSSGLSPEQQTRANSQLLQLQLASWKKELAGAIRDGLQGFKVMADGRALTDVTRNSTRNGTRPGG